MLVPVVLLLACGTDTAATATRGAEVATLTAVALPTVTPTPWPTFPPPPTVNPTIRAYQAIQATQADARRAAHCWQLSRYYSDLGRYYDASLGAEGVYLELLRLMDILPGSSGSRSVYGVAVTKSVREAAYGCLG